MLRLPSIGIVYLFIIVSITRTSYLSLSKRKYVHVFFCNVKTGVGSVTPTRSSSRRFVKSLSSLQVIENLARQLFFRIRIRYPTVAIYWFINRLTGCIESPRLCFIRSQLTWKIMVKLLLKNTYHFGNCSVYFHDSRISIIFNSIVLFITDFYQGLRS